MCLFTADGDGNGRIGRFWTTTTVAINPTGSYIMLVMMMMRPIRSDGGYDNGDVVICCYVFRRLSNILLVTITIAFKTPRWWKCSRFSSSMQRFFA